MTLRPCLYVQMAEVVEASHSLTSDLLAAYESLSQLKGQLQEQAGKITELQAQGNESTTLISEMSMAVRSPTVG